VRWLVLVAALAACSDAPGVGYTIFSEWANTSVRQGWQYSALMPTLKLGSVVIGLSPLAQWIVLPPLALYLARRGAIGVT
jgi:hypothetical protein